MNRLVNFLGTIVIVIMTVTGFYFSNFSGGSLLLGGGMILLWTISEYLLKCNTELDELNNKLSNENDNFKERISILSGKISSIAIVANQGSPYKILALSEADIHKGINKNEEYVIEITISTIDKKYDIKYLNISFNERVAFNQDNNRMHINSMYKIVSNFAKTRNGRYEYNFELTDDYLDRTCAKCVFNFKYQLDKKINLNIEVCSDNGISKIETFNC